MEDIKVTVYFSTYNQEPYVAQALESILMQKTNFRFEIIAADDCSTDRTQEIILDYQRRYPGMIETYFTNPNVGGCRKLRTVSRGGSSAESISLSWRAMITGSARTGCRRWWTFWRRIRSIQE